MEFPLYVWKHKPPRGYDSLLVSDQVEHANALAAGWLDDLSEAIAGVVAQPKRIEPAPEEDHPPTRAELEQKAHELGVVFAPQLGDKKLAERIAEALAKG